MASVMGKKKKVGKVCVFHRLCLIVLYLWHNDWCVLVCVCVCMWVGVCGCVCLFVYCLIFSIAANLPQVVFVLITKESKEQTRDSVSSKS